MTGVRAGSDGTGVRSGSQGTGVAGGGSGFALDSAILAANPFGYWKMNDPGTAFVDYGSLGNVATPPDIARTEFQQVVAGDGRSYARFKGSTGSGAKTAANALYSSAPTGRSLLFFARAESNVSSQFYVAMGDGDLEVVSVSSNFGSNNTVRMITQFTRVNGLNQATRTINNGIGVVPNTGWMMVSVTTSSDTGAASIPTLQINGTTPASTPTLEGTAVATTNAYMNIGGYSAVGNNLIGAMGHVCLFDGALSQPVLDGIYAAAVADGWTFASLL